MRRPYFPQSHILIFLVLPSFPSHLDCSPFVVHLSWCSRWWACPGGWRILPCCCCSNWRFASGPCSCLASASWGRGWWVVMSTWQWTCSAVPPWTNQTPQTSSSASTTTTSSHHPSSSTYTSPTPPRHHHHHHISQTCYTSLSIQTPSYAVHNHKRYSSIHCRRQMSSCRISVRHVVTSWCAAWIATDSKVCDVASTS